MVRPTLKAVDFCGDQRPGLCQLAHAIIRRRLPPFRIPWPESVKKVGEAFQRFAPASDIRGKCIARGGESQLVLVVFIVMPRRPPLYGDLAGAFFYDQFTSSFHRLKFGSNQTPQPTRLTGADLLFDLSRRVAGL